MSAYADAVEEAKKEARANMPVIRPAPEPEPEPAPKPKPKPAPKGK